MWIKTGLLLLLAGFSFLSHAHTRSLSHSAWQWQDGNIQMSIRLSLYDLTRMQLHPLSGDDYPQQVATKVRQQLRLWHGTQACHYDDSLSAQQQQGWITLHMRLHCPSDSQGAWRLRSQLFESAIAAHQHFATAQLGDQQQSFVLHSGHNEWQFRSQDTAHAANFIGLGFTHILSGWDHLAFVLGLLLLARRPIHLLWLISGFTLGHSLSLAAATFGLVASNSQLVESLIGLSIALLAVELCWKPQRGLWLPATFCAGLLCLSAIAAPAARLALWGMVLFIGCYFALLQHSAKPQRWQLLLSSSFGLIHGFGFAGLLAQIDLDSAQRPMALLGFNIGVELGQILVVVLAGLVLAALARWRQVINDVATAALAGLGSYWLVLRLFM